jgi:thioredoxin-like negative regulator of GroEL
MKRILILTIIISFITELNAQVNFKDARGLYEDGNYQIALKQFKKLYRKKKDDVDLNYYIAMCYLNSDAIKSEALPYLKKNKEKHNRYITRRFRLPISTSNIS